MCWRKDYVRFYRQMFVASVSQRYACFFVGFFEPLEFITYELVSSHTFLQKHAGRSTLSFQDYARLCCAPDLLYVRTKNIRELVDFYGKILRPRHWWKICMCQSDYVFAMYFIIEPIKSLSEPTVAGFVIYAIRSSSWAIRPSNQILWHQSRKRCL